MAWYEREVKIPRISFVDITDWVSYSMGTPFNIIVWIVLIFGWSLLFAFGIITDNSNLFPKWVDSNAYNFPLNTGTSVLELYIGFLVGAAANRSERKLHSTMEKIEQMITILQTNQEIEIKQEQEIKSILNADN